MFVKAVTISSVSLSRLAHINSGEEARVSPGSSMETLLYTMYIKTRQMGLFSFIAMRKQGCVGGGGGGGGSGGFSQIELDRIIFVDTGQ